MKNRITKAVKKNKYGAIKTLYNGVRYDSKMEALYAEELDWLLKAGEIKSWVRQVNIILAVNGIKICTYRCDFRVITKEGKIQYQEVKGKETDSFKIKWKLFGALLGEIHPGAEMIIIK